MDKKRGDRSSSPQYSSSRRGGNRSYEGVSESRSRNKPQGISKYYVVGVVGAIVFIVGAYVRREVRVMKKSIEDINRAHREVPPLSEERVAAIFSRQIGMFMAQQQRMSQSVAPADNGSGVGHGVGQGV
jgi:hypothetical protein